MSPAPLAEALNALSQFLVADATLGTTLQRVAEIAVEALPPAKFAGLSMLDEHGRPTTAIFTDASSPEIDEAQYQSGRGPCLDAWRSRRPVRVDDLRLALDDYPEFGRAAVEHGIASTLSFPLLAGDDSLGALNLYAADIGAFSGDDEVLGSQVTAAAAAVLANSVSYWGAFDLSQQMRAAMQSRAVIEQAKGFLMARSPSVTAEDAFRLLVEASQRENVKLRVIAERIVQRRGSRRPEEATDAR